MEIRCEVCKAVFKIRDGVIPSGKKVRHTCKKCRSTQNPLSGKEDSTGPEPLPSPPAEDPTIAPDAAPSSPSANFWKKRIVSGIKNLSPMPHVVMSIHSQLARENVDTLKVIEAIRVDQALAAKVLRLANSAYYGLTGRVSTIESALTLVGLRGMLEAVAAAGSYRLLSASLPGYGYDAEDLWRHSIAVACGCKVIAHKKDPGLSDTAYLAGLIHDVGKLILDRFVAEKKAEIDSFLQDGNRTLLDAEAHFFGFSHASVAAEVCGAWNFPDLISNAIRFHHNPTGSDKDFLSYLLHLADYLAISFGLGYESDDHLYALEEGTLAFLGVNRSDFSDIVSRISEALQAVSSSFSQ